MTRAAGEGRGLPATPPTPTPAPLSMVCCCLAEQMRRLMPSMTWLLESTSFSRGFLLRKMVGTGKQAGTTLSLERPWKGGCALPHPLPPFPGKGGDSKKADSPLPPAPPVCLWGYVSGSPNSCPSPWASVSSLSNENLGPDGLGVPSGSNVLKACGWGPVALSGTSVHPLRCLRGAVSVWLVGRLHRISALGHPRRVSGCHRQFQLRAWHRACPTSWGTFRGRGMNAKAQLLWMPPEEEGGTQQRRKPLPDSWEAMSTPESPRLLQRVQSQMWGFTMGTNICEHCCPPPGVGAPPHLLRVQDPCPRWC